LAEKLYQIVIIVFAILAFLTGFYTQNIFYCLGVYAVGLALSLLIAVPNWPFFNRNPPKWLDEVSGIDPTPPAMSKFL